MFIKNQGKNITKKEMREIYIPHAKVMKNYCVNIIIPEVCAFYLASGYKSNAIEEDDYNTHLKTCIVMFNLLISKKDFNIIKNNTTDLLKSRYELVVINDKPLAFKSLYL